MQYYQTHIITRHRVAINDNTVTPSLMVNFGDLGSKKAATGSWQMISTLSGKFIEFRTSYSHASELGGELTSLIKVVTPHFLVHMVKVNLPGRDNRLDFLADPSDTSNLLGIYESEIPNGSNNIADARTPVTIVSPLAVPARPTPETPRVSVTLQTLVNGTTVTGWVYTKMPDPSQGLLKLLDVVRADGVHLDLRNFWVDQGLDKDYKKTWTLQFVDYRADGSTPGAYTLVFTTPDVDTTPPATTLIFDGPASGTNPAYITPETRLLLTATDNDGGSGVDGMYRKVVGQDNDFVPALPFNLTTPGSYTVQYYSTDLAGNVETPPKSASVVVVDAAPTISSFAVTPATFSPQAPRGVAAVRTADFRLSATSPVATLPVEIAIAPGSSFQANQVIRTLKGTASPGTELHLAWDGKDGSGNLLPKGTYTVQAKVTDGLVHPADITATATVTIDDWFRAAPVDPYRTVDGRMFDQKHPRVSGKKVVWQDYRNGKGDIYMKDLADMTAFSTLIPRAGDNSADRDYPAIDGNYVVWQDYRNGKWDLYGYNLQTSSEIRICTTADCSETGDKERPAISGEWVVWQDNRDGNRDIFAQKVSDPTNPDGVIRITSKERDPTHERDQLHPAISGTTVTWEDYRHGFGETYKYDLATHTETQVASGPADETFPAISGTTLVWSDRRSGQSDIYTADAARGALRVTYDTGDHSQAAVLNDLLIYTDYESGADDPNLSFRLLTSGTGGRLTSDPARQEEPAIGTELVVWQDNRDGKWQIYTASFATETFPIEAQIKPGFNLLAAGNWLASQYPSATALIAAKGDELGIDRLLNHDPLHNTYSEATTTAGDFTLVKGMGLVIYAQKPGTLKLADSGETSAYTLLPGTNQIGILTVPAGYSAFDLMKSVGLDNIQSVRRFDNTTGAWQTVAVRMTSAADGSVVNGLVGQNFSIQPGDGLVITMKNRVDGWMP